VVVEQSVEVQILSDAPWFSGRVPHSSFFPVFSRGYFLGYTGIIGSGDIVIFGNYGILNGRGIKA
jgi:hypothetical protein